MVSPRLQTVLVAVDWRVVSYVDYSDLESSVGAVEGYRTIKNSKFKPKASYPVMWWGVYKLIFGISREAGVEPKPFDVVGQRINH